MGIERCVQDGFLGVSQSNTNPRGKPFLWSFRHVFKVKEIASYPGLLQQMKPGSIILNQRLKDNPWSSTIFNLHECVCVCVCVCACVSISRTIMVPVSQHCDRNNSDAGMRTVIELRKLFKQVQLYKIVTDLNAITEFGWTLLPHPPYSTIQYA